METSEIELTRDKPVSTHASGQIPGVLKTYDIIVLLSRPVPHTLTTLHYSHTSQLTIEV